MRDIVTDFYCGVMGRLIASGKISTSDIVLVICEGRWTKRSLLLAHRAFPEMYRVARKAVVAFEARDNLTMRTAMKPGLTVDYRADSMTPGGKKGIAETGIPISSITGSNATRSRQLRHSTQSEAKRRALLRSPHPVSSAWLHIKAYRSAVRPTVQSLCHRLAKSMKQFAFATSKTGKKYPWTW